MQPIFNLHVSLHSLKIIMQKYAINNLLISLDPLATKRLLKNIMAQR